MVDGKASIARAIESYYVSGGRPFPWRRKRISPWGILVAEMMLKMTTAKKVTPVWEGFLRRYPFPEEVLRSRRREMLDILRPLGLEFQRLRSLRDLAKALVEDYGGKIPMSEAELVALPGVGPYTARAFLWMVGIAAAPPVDRNIARVVSRFYLRRGRKNLTSEELLSPWFRRPREGRAVFLGLLDISANFCRPAHPRCAPCPLQRMCATGQKRSKLVAFTPP